MSPFEDLGNVAAAGKKARLDSTGLLGISAIAAAEYIYNALKSHLAQGGTFDYQRRKYRFGRDGFTQLRQFRNVSNFNVGLFCQQAGLSLESTLYLAGRYAGEHSGNAMPGEPYGLDPQTREYIELGHKIGESGAYDPPDRC